MSRIVGILIIIMMACCASAFIIQPGSHVSGEAHNMYIENPQYPSTAYDIVYSMGECRGCGDCTVVIGSNITTTYGFTPRTDTNGMRYTGEIYLTGLIPISLGAAEETKPDSCKAGQPFVYTVTEEVPSATPPGTYDFTWKIYNPAETAPMVWIEKCRITYVAAP